MTIEQFLKAYQFRYASEVARVIKAHQVHFKRDIGSVALDVAMAVNDYSEGVVKEAMKLYLEKYSKNHPSYFVGICKRFYREQGGLINKKPSWGKPI